MRQSKNTMKRINKILLSLFLLLSLFVCKKSNNEVNNEYIEYHFRNDKLLSEHYQKHGIDMGFKNKQDYEKAASDAVNNPDALHKLEKEDNDDVYYVEETNEFVIIYKDDYIRTYFLPDDGKKYFDKQ